MVQHTVSVTVDAPVHQVYAMFTHFNDYPKFMSYVKEVTYIDDTRSHWVVDVLGHHEWDAVNVNWIPDRQVGWRSIGGTRTSGRITFEPEDVDKTVVTATIEYEPPGGALGQIGESLGAGSVFETRLRNDLEHFARMVEEAPAGALDPTSSTYLFHDASAAARGTTTPEQDRSMGMPTSTEEHVTMEELDDGTVPDVPGTTPRESR